MATPALQPDHASEPNQTLQLYRNGELPKGSSRVMPNSTDNAHVVTAKLHKCLMVLDEGGSLAAATGYIASTHTAQCPETVAVQMMTEDEREAFHAWQAGLSSPLPTVDWNSIGQDPPKSKNSLKTAQRRSEALNRLYDDDQAGPAHSAWFSREYPEILPLLKAIGRVIGVERNSRGGARNCDRYTLAEVQTLREIVRIATHALQDRDLEGEPGKANLRRANKALALVNAQRKRLRQLLVDKSAV